jgi:hypothetical protein
MKYEDFLVVCREAGATAGGEFERISRLKVISTEIDANRDLGEWLEQQAGAITVITDEDDAVAELTRLKASGDVIGIDIETARVADYADHLQAGLHPQGEPHPAGAATPG